MAWIDGDAHTLDGWSAVMRQSAAVIRLAEPSTALACGESGWASESAIACQLIPSRTSGRYIAPANTNWFPMSTKGIEPLVSYLSTSASCAAVGVSRRTWFRSLVSTAWKSMYELVNVAPWNVNVGVFG